MGSLDFPIGVDFAVHLADIIKSQVYLHLLWLDFEGVHLNLNSILSRGNVSAEPHLVPHLYCPLTKGAPLSSATLLLIPSLDRPS